MSERKVLNKYYPPDFDPNKIPRLKRPKNRQFSIRIMAPFNMRCANCGEYIYKGKKFNSRQERVEDEDYLGLMIFRFYIKCPRCVSEISFKTDPQNCDYALEAGATRNFEALRTAERLAEQELKEKEEEEKNNPMKVLENRTKASQQEMEMLETLEELRELNSRHAKLDHEEILQRHKAYEEQLRQLQDEEDEQFIRSIFGKSISGETIKRVHDDDKDDAVADTDGTGPFHSSSKRSTKPTDILTETSTGGGVQNHKSGSGTPERSGAAWQKSIGSFSKKSSLLGIVRKKNTTETKKTDDQEERASKSQDDCTETTITAAAAAANTSPTTNVDSESAVVAGVNSTCTQIKANAVPKDNIPVHEDKNESCKLSQSNATTEGSVVSKPTGLGMLGAYSDTSSEESD